MHTMGGHGRPAGSSLFLISTQIGLLAGAAALEDPLEAVDVPALERGGPRVHHQHAGAVAGEAYVHDL